MFNLVAFSGLAWVGKDAASQVLLEKYGFKEMKFSEPVKSFVYILNPYIHISNDLMVEFDLPNSQARMQHYLRFADVIDTIGVEKAKKIPEVRRLYQVFGTDVGRAIDPDLWVNFFDKKKRELGHDKVVVTDLRFPNEANAIRNAGGIVINIVNPNIEKINNHASEAGLCSELYNDYIVNNASIEELHMQVENIVVYG